MRSQVLNNSEGPIYAQMQPRSKEMNGALVHGELVIFERGLNLVDAEKLKELIKNETFAKLFKTTIPPSRAPERDQTKVGKTILEIAGKDVDDGHPLAKLNEQAAKAMIAEVESTDMLKAWLDAEGRPEVRRFITARAEAIAATIVVKQ